MCGDEMVVVVPELVEGRYLLRADVISLAFRLGRPLVHLSIALQTFTHWNKTAGFEAKRIP